MVFFWTKGPSTLKVETRFDNDTLEFVLTIVSPDGSHSSERFGDVQPFQARLVELEHRLRQELWETSGPPLIEPDGLPARRP